jgi:hypothetical protein
VFTARYELIPYISRSSLVFKWLLSLQQAKSPYQEFHLAVYQISWSPFYVLVHPVPTPRYHLVTFVCRCFPTRCLQLKPICPLPCMHLLRILPVIRAVRPDVFPVFLSHSRQMPRCYLLSCYCLLPYRLQRIHCTGSPGRVTPCCWRNYTLWWWPEFTRLFNPLPMESNPSDQNCRPRFLLGILIFKGLIARLVY